MAVELSHVDADVLSPPAAEEAKKAVPQAKVAAPAVPSEGKGAGSPEASLKSDKLKARHQGGIELMAREFTAFAAEKEASFSPVSYTHLTLPTILRV